MLESKDETEFPMGARIFRVLGWVTLIFLLASSLFLFLFLEEGIRRVGISTFALLAAVSLVIPASFLLAAYALENKKPWGVIFSVIISDLTLTAVVLGIAFFFLC
jgi:hypothetical protein